MKLFLPLLIQVFFLFSSHQSFSQDFNNAGEYMSAIGKQRENITKKFMSYASAAAHGKRAKKVDNLRAKLLDEVQEARMNISGLGGYKGDKSYRDTAVNFMKLYYNILNEDYSKIINLEEIAEQSYDDMEAYIMAHEMIDKKLEEGNAKMKAVVESFAAKHNVTLVDRKDALSEMTRQVSEVNTYHNEVFLVFFKANIQESNMLKAIEKGNITGIEQSRSALLKYAQEGLEKYKTMKGFQGDNNLLSAGRNILGFYAKEAANNMNAITEYFLIKERFEATKKEYDKKGNPSKDDVNNYNKIVNEMNKASQAYNAANQDLYKQRSKMINEWNKALKSFFDDHTPRYR